MTTINTFPDIRKKADRLDQLAREADDALADLEHTLKNCKVRIETWAPPSGHFRLCYTQIRGEWRVGIYDGGENRVLQDEPVPTRIAAARDLPRLVKAIDRALEEQIQQIESGELPHTPLGDLTSPSILAPAPAAKGKTK